MITKIDNDADEFAMLQAVDQTHSIAYSKLLALLANLTPEGEDFEIVIRRSLLPTSYRGNPTMLARNAFVQINPNPFQSCGAYSLSNTHIGVKFSLEERQMGTNIRSKTSTSANAQILRWLDTITDENADDAELLINIADVSASILARPEQLVYNIKRQTERRIKIKKLKKHLKITLK